MDFLVLWIAQGFGTGRIAFAPGTFGSLAGLLWVLLLLATRDIWLYLAGTGIGVLISVWLCGRAEKILKTKDPSSVVLDEIVALPVCFIPIILDEWLRTGALPDAQLFFAGQNWKVVALVFALFRIFDIAKPWPVRQSQSLPGGWGVTMDDVLAGLYVALLTLLMVA